MIEHNIRVRKCKNCGKYSALKGDYNTDYCDRIPDGEKFTCKKLAVMKARKKKAQDSSTLKYRKVYKRMHVHLSNHKISNEDFRFWAKAVVNKRDSSLAEYSPSPSDNIINQPKEYSDNK